MILTLLGSLITSRLSRMLVISGLTFVAGTYTGSTLAIKYYKAKEVAALNAQIAHNSKVIVWSRKEIVRLTDEEERLEALVEELNDAANKSPNADRPSLDLDGVRRLNRTSYTPGTIGPT